MKYEHVNLQCLVAILTIVISTTAVVAQTDDSAPAKGAVIKGRILQPDDKRMGVSFEELKVELVEQVRLPTPSLPGNWAQMKPPERKKWATEFEASEEGQKLVKRRQELIDSARKFDIKIEEDGNFVVYDVPPGRYGLHGRSDRKIGERSFALEILGQVDVEKKVDELLLDPIMIMSTPLIKVGEDTPEIEIETFDGKNTLKNVHLKGRYVLVNFWAQASPPSVELLPQIQEMYQRLKQKHKFELLSVNLDEDRQQALQFVIKEKITGWHGYAGDWEHAAVIGFGVRAIPAVFLLGPDGKILMTHGQFLAAMNPGDRDLTQIIEDRITGRDKPTEAVKPPASDPDTSGK